tara:strand:- start:221 stop:592 length:372 start_codon:yes stop_codon:yes gene_type:complete
MSELKLCQGPECHTYFTKDRVKGPKGSKTNQTRRRSWLVYGEFCDTRCYNDWFNKYGTRAVDHFGRTTEVKHLTEDNAWIKDYDYNGWNNKPDNYYFVNRVTKERRPLTEEQYNDNNYTLNER